LGSSLLEAEFVGSAIKIVLFFDKYKEGFAGERFKARGSRLKMMNIH
jgi:hypothetical protein